MNILFIIVGIIVICFGIYINLKKPVTHAILPYAVGLVLVIIGSPLKDRLTEFRVSLQEGFYVKLSEPTITDAEEKSIKEKSSQSINNLYNSLAQNQTPSKEESTLDDPNYFDYLKELNFWPTNFDNSHIVRPGNIIRIEEGEAYLVASAENVFPGANPETYPVSKFGESELSTDSFVFQCLGAKEVKLHPDKLLSVANLEKINKQFSSKSRPKLYVVIRSIECSSIRIGKKEPKGYSNSAKPFHYSKKGPFVIAFQPLELSLLK